MSGVFWYCEQCGAQNHETDGECQFCECGGRECKRDTCSGSHQPHTPECNAVNDASPTERCVCGGA